MILLILSFIFGIIAGLWLAWILLRISEKYIKLNE